MRQWKPSTLWTLGIMVAWLVMVLIYQSGFLDDAGGSNANKYALVIGFVFAGPLLAVWNWIYLRKREKKEEDDV